MLPGKIGFFSPIFTGVKMAASLLQSLNCQVDIFLTGEEDDICYDVDKQKHKINKITNLQYDGLALVFSDDRLFSDLKDAIKKGITIATYKK